MEKMEIGKMLKNKVIETTETLGVASPIFFKIKPSGKYRCILDLSDVNLSVHKEKFKMQSISAAIALSRHNMWYRSFDLSDAYHTALVHKKSRKFLQFWSGGQLYQYRGLPNGLSSAPKDFTDLLKPVSNFLNYIGIISIIYLDDLLIMNMDYDTLQAHTSILCQTLMYLGFLPNLEKSSKAPSHQIEFLGFILDSTTQSISLPSKKLEKITQKCTHFSQLTTCTKRQLASLVGNLVATTHAIIPAPLNFRHLQLLLINTVSEDWETTIHLTNGAYMDLKWWIKNANAWNGTPWAPEEPTVNIQTDASLTGWGATSSLGLSAAENWTTQERSKHINHLELIAIQ